MGKIRYEVVKGESEYSEAIEELYHQNDRAHGGIFFDRSIIQDINKLAKDYRKNIYMICAIEDGKLVGFAQLTDAYVPDSLYITILAVDKGHRNQGIGSGLVDYAIHHSIGHKTVSIEAFTSNEDAVRLYTNLGFEFVLSYSIKNVGVDEEEQNFFQIPIEKIKDNNKMEYTQKEVKSRRDVSEIRNRQGKTIEEASVFYDLDEPISQR